MDASTGSRGRTWREDMDLPAPGIRAFRGGRRRPPVRSAPRRSPGAILVPDWLSLQLVRQVAAAAVILVLLAAGLRLPYGLGDRLNRSLAVVLERDVDVQAAAATLRTLAERGRVWMASELGSEQAVLPAAGAGAEEGAQGPSFWVWPVDGPVLAAYGWRQTTAGEPELHEGVDVAAGEGSPVVAAASGTVVRVWTDPERLGRVVEIDHGGGWSTRYAHLGEVFVAEGDRVLQGDVIAEVGVSDDAGEPHLHFEMLFEGRPVDPEPKLHRGKTGS